MTGVVFVSCQRIVDVTFTDYLLCHTRGYKQNGKKKKTTLTIRSVRFLFFNVSCVVSTSCLSRTFRRSHFNDRTEDDVFLYLAVRPLGDTIVKKTSTASAIHWMIMKQLIGPTLLAEGKDRLSKGTEPSSVQRGPAC